ncbi:MAG: hypothetical protein WCD42_11445 [Rhizomicrobium sp.]
MTAPVSVNDANNEPIRLPTADLSGPLPDRDGGPYGEDGPARPHSKIAALLAAVVLSSLWASGVGAYLMGYFGARGPAGLDAQQWAIFAIVTIVPPLLFMAVAWVLIRGQAMGEAAEAFAVATEQLFAADETASRTATRIGKAVRRELDALNSGLDTAFSRMQAMQDQLENQIGAIDAAGLRLNAHGESLAGRLAGERDRIDSGMKDLSDASARVSEKLAGRVGELKGTIDAAEKTLKSAGEALEVQSAKFSKAAGAAAEAPHAVAVELDKQVKRIESVADAAMARAEFVLGRQERHRVAMNETLQRLKEDGLSFETSLSAEREAMERMLATLDGEAQKFAGLAAESERRIDSIMGAASTRTTQLAQTFVREAAGLKEVGEAAAEALALMVSELHKAGLGAQALITEASGQTKASASALVTSALSECGKLLQTADALAAESRVLRAAMADAVEDVQRHTVSLPALAQTEVQKVRDVVRQESEAMLTLSAEVLATLHSRATPTAPPKPEKALPHDEAEAGLGFFRRRLGAGKHKTGTEKVWAPGAESEKNWQISTLLAAAEGPTRPKQAPASALQILQATLTEMAVDLDAIASDDGPQLAEWRKFLAGDRGVFARKLASAIDGETVHRIAMLYRENAVFRDSADNYLREFEALMAEVRKSDTAGRGSLLATSLLSADTGKIYLAISYALGRL